MKRRILSLVLVLSLLIGAAVRPQRAEAVALTATVVAASAAAVLTACGVSYWAATQTDAIDYIAGKIDDYLDSIGETGTTYEDWLEISGTSQLFEVVSGGVMRFGSGVANKLLDFCRWLQDDEGIESGGDPVGVMGNLSVVSFSYNNYSEGVVYYKIMSDRVRFDLDGFLTTNTRYGATATIKLLVMDGGSEDKYLSYNASSDKITLTYKIYDQNGNRLISGQVSQSSTKDITSYVSSGGYIDLTCNYNLATPITGTMDVFITGIPDFTPTVLVSPSDFVNVPAAIDAESIFLVKPSVALDDGDTVDDAADTILDGITSEDGLSSTVEGTPGTSWGWLYTLLVNIAEAITDGVADIKQAVLGLADSIYSKFTTILQDIKTGITTIVNSITSAVSQLLSAIQTLPTTIYSQFTQVLQDIKTGIQGIALDIYTDVINALTYVFVPSQAFIDTYVSSLYATFDNHFSILSYPFSILGEFITRASGIGNQDPVFRWGNIYEPFSGNLLIAAGSYNLNDALSNDTFAYMYQLYMIVVKGFMSFWFLRFLYAWFCDVFKMREDDFDNPMGFEPEDDTEDFDGYDGYYSS